MASSSGNPKGGGKRVNYGRRFFWFALAIVLAGALYTAGWFYAADRVVSEVNAGIAAVNGDGRRANCENPQARGYPFRMGLFCRSVMFEDAGKGVRFQAGALRSAAQVYQPRHVIAELDGPASLEAPGISALELDWSSLRASVRLASPMPERVSFVGGDMTVRLDEPGDVSPLLLRAEAAELHLRPAGDGLDIAVRFSGLALDEELVGPVALPPLNGLADIFVEGSGPGLRGRSGEIRTLSVSIDDETGVTVAGPFSVDADGLVDAQLRISLRNPKALSALLSDLLPEARREIELSFAGLAAIGDAPTLPLRIRRGEIRLGFIRLGAIPPL